jgi:solute carrier family 25 (mitochondrial ornithine transporter) member 2/15
VALPVRMSNVYVMSLNDRIFNLGATTSMYVGQPLDTIKTKLQTFPDRYQNFSDCAKKILRNDGLRGFYAGSVPSLLANTAG